VTEAVIMDHCRSQLAKYKMPRRIFFMEKLPRNEGGKVSKKQLVQLLPAHIEGVLNAK
jgi:acyl-coenzyme A synthetase/AMP-(fatty) acid ligase